MSVFSKIKEAFVKSEDKDKYLSGLDRSKKSFGDRMRALSNNFHGIDDDLLEQIMVILLESDVGIHTAQKIVDAFESNGKHVKEYDSMLDYLVSILYDFYDESNDEPIKMNEEGPTVILMVGVNGSGKTTTSAKLIQYYKEQGKKVAVAAADTFRAGAIDQIDTWATRLGVHCVKGKMNQDPSSVLVDACRYAKENDVDILICDTAGRLQNKTNLMNELSKMHRVVQREIEGAPQEVWLVLDATTGQNGISQAKVFLEATDVTGIVLTKMDGTAKGGIAVAIQAEFGIPVKYVGVGEKVEDLQKFDSDTFVNALFDVATDDEDEEPRRRHGFWLLVTTAIATSLDAMAVGVGLAFLQVNIIATALAIGCATLIMSTLGMMVGRFIGSIIGKKAEILGGLVLIGIGVQILWTHFHG